MKAPTTIQTRYTVNFCEPRRWEKVSSLERDMNHNTAMNGRRPNRDDEINNRPVNKKISHIGCTILDWNNALILSNPFSKWIGFNWNECWFIWSSQVSCPVVFKQFRNLIKLGRFYRITWDRNAPSFATGLDDGQRKESQVGFTSYGITLHISSVIVSIVNFRIWWDHCVKSLFKK